MTDVLLFVLDKNHDLQKCEWISRLILLKLSKSTHVGKKTKLQKGMMLHTLCVLV